MFYDLTEKKGKRHNTYIVPQATPAAALALFCHRADAQPIGCRLSLRPRNSDLRLTAICSLVCHLMVSTPVIHVSTWITGVGLVGWPIADTLPTKWSHANHRSDIDHGKSASQIPTS